MPEAPVPVATASASTTAEVAAPPRLPCASGELIRCTEGCNDHLTEDCVTLGIMYLSGSVVTVDTERAATLFRAACEADSARACLHLAYAHHNGFVTPLPSERANPHAAEVTLYKRACDLGANEGCLSAGRAFVDGHGGPKDPVSAAELFERVCSRGNASACFELGRLHARGEGVARKPDRARDLFLKACQLGLEEGCLRADEKRGEPSRRR
ncbi:MAG: tetratricopeptide repeat protein [Minicystis sp.]